MNMNLSKDEIGIPYTPQIKNADILQNRVKACDMSKKLKRTKNLRSVLDNIKAGLQEVSLFKKGKSGGTKVFS